MSLAEPAQLVKHPGDSAYVGVRLQELYVAGTVFAEGVKSVPGAALIAGGQSTQTEAAGRLKVPFRVPGGTARLPLTVSAKGYRPFTNEATPSVIQSGGGRPCGARSWRNPCYGVRLRFWGPAAHA
jgi:hypothetical protein